MKPSDQTRCLADVAYSCIVVSHLYVRAHHGLHDGFQRVVSVLPLAGARLAKTQVIFVIPDCATDFATTMEEPAVGGARRVQVTVAAVLPVAIWTVVAIKDSVRSGRTG